VDILLAFSESRDWKVAMEKVIPLRKRSETSPTSPTDQKAEEEEQKSNSEETTEPVEE
jgi:hypothetical protein